jgi:hypothetical protein
VISERSFHADGDFVADLAKRHLADRSFRLAVRDAAATLLCQKVRYVLDLMSAAMSVRGCPNAIRVEAIREVEEIIRKDAHREQERIP